MNGRLPSTNDTAQRPLKFLPRRGLSYMNNKMLLSATALRTLAVGFAFTMGSFTAAQAQTAPPAQTETPTESSDPATLNPQSEVELESGQNDTADNDQVVVTGTRIRAPNLTSAVPITSVGVQDLLDSG